MINSLERDLLEQFTREFKLLNVRNSDIKMDIYYHDSKSIFFYTLYFVIYKKQFFLLDGVKFKFIS